MLLPRNATRRLPPPLPPPSTTSPWSPHLRPPSAPTEPGNGIPTSHWCSPAPSSVRSGHRSSPEQARPVAAPCLPGEPHHPPILAPIDLPTSFLSPPRSFQTSSPPPRIAGAAPPLSATAAAATARRRTPSGRPQPQSSPPRGRAWPPRAVSPPLPRLRRPPSLGAGRPPPPLFCLRPGTRWQAPKSFQGPLCEVSFSFLLFSKKQQTRKINRNS